jgi:hypothetical protein
MKTTARMACLTALLASVLTAPHVEACAVCFGRTDSPLGKGLHWGVLALLEFIFLVLSAVGAFAVYLARRAAAVESEDSAAQNVAPENAIDPDPTTHLNPPP